MTYHEATLFRQSKRAGQTTYAVPRSPGDIPLLPNQLHLDHQDTYCLVRWMLPPLPQGEVLAAWVREDSRAQTQRVTWSGPSIVLNSSQDLFMKLMLEE